MKWSYILFALNISIFSRACSVQVTEVSLYEPSQEEVA